MKHDNLGNRIKRYEKVSSHHLSRRMPVIIRVDGRAFHSLKLKKPFDGYFMHAMIDAAFRVSKEMQGFKICYVQSDEASFLLTDYDRIETESWFDYNLSKVISLSASLMTMNFNLNFPEQFACFDSRAFNIPESDVTNYFLWRIKDWNRNSLQMYSRSFFSHKQLYKKNKDNMHEMLHSINRNWTTDLTSLEKNGIFFYRDEQGIIFTSFENDNINYKVIQDIFDKIFNRLGDNN